MNARIKGLAVSAVMSMAGFLVWNLIVGVQPNPMGILIIGGGVGLFTGFIASIVRGGQAPVVVGALTTVLVWFAFSAAMVSEFGMSGFDTFKFVTGTVVIAILGGSIGFGYKLGSR